MTAYTPDHSMSGRVIRAHTRFIVSLACDYARDRGFDGRVSYRLDRYAIELERKGLLEWSRSTSV